MSKAAARKKEEQEPKAKRLKVEEEDDDEEEETTTTPTLRNDEGNAYFELSAKRRVTVRKWRGNVLVDIREVCKEQMNNKFIKNCHSHASHSTFRSMKRTEKHFQERRELV